MEILKVNGLTKVYASFKGAKEVSALNGLNFTVNSGE
ncbi:MAG TPA: multidrug ABC transporter ATP-binding protein, partial [Clostridium sp.]|nr:multidrug ABC transporter ATP-binding protein [Clostridium sp.]